MAEDRCGLAECGATIILDGSGWSHKIKTADGWVRFCCGEHQTLYEARRGMRGFSTSKVVELPQAQSSAIRQ